jgi:alpha-tubulin suppressor-like RCC1 family protein
MTLSQPLTRLAHVGRWTAGWLTLLVVSTVVVVVAPTAHATGPGTPFAWGNNAFGQLGDGTTMAHLSPRAVLSIDDAVDLSGGREHVVALRSDGQVWTWGSNNFGQIGDGTAQNRPAPTLVNGIANVTDVATGHYHTLAIRSDGTAWGWGYNTLGQLGDGSTTNRRTPVRIGSLTGVVGVAGGRSMTYVLLANGTLWATGANADGQLGNGTRTTSLSPVRVGTLTDVVSIAGGRDHGLAVLGDGTVWAWGDNAYGQLGDGTLTDRTAPVQVGGIANAMAVIAGAHHSVALRADGTVLTWGRNNLGQLGDRTTTLRRVPVPVAGLTGVTAIGAGRDHTLVVMSDATVRAWGRNDFGQLGDGTTINRLAPVPVPGLADAEDVHGGQSYSVALVGASEPDTTPPSAPGKPLGQSTSPGTIALTWTAASDDRSATLTYHVLRDGEEVGTTVSSASTVGFSDVGLLPGDVHVYVVWAEDASSNDGPQSEASDPITVTASPPVIFADDFSSGTLANWTAITRFSIDGSMGAPVPPSARASVSGQTSTMVRILGASYGNICVSLRVNVTARTGSVRLWRLRTAGDGPVARVSLNDSGVLTIRSDVSGATRSSGVALGSGWHLVELCGSVGTAGSWDLYRDGSRIVAAWVSNTGTAGVGRLEVGSSTATWTANIDDVRVDQSPG